MSKKKTTISGSVLIPAFEKVSIDPKISIEKISCPICRNVHFSTTELYLKHILQRHRETDSLCVFFREDKAPLGFQCKVCRKLLKSKSALKDHSNSHSAALDAISASYVVFPSHGSVASRGSHRMVQKLPSIAEEEVSVRSSVTGFSSDASSSLIKCTLCPCSYKKVTQLTRHIGLVHKDVVDVSVFNISGKAQYLRCPTCKNACNGQKGLTIHWGNRPECKPKGSSAGNSSGENVGRLITSESDVAAPRPPAAQIVSSSPLNTQLQQRASNGSSSSHASSKKQSSTYRRRNSQKNSLSQKSGAGQSFSMSSFMKYNSQTPLGYSEDYSHSESAAKDPERPISLEKIFGDDEAFLEMLTDELMDSFIFTRPLYKTDYRWKEPLHKITQHLLSLMVEAMTVELPDAKLLKLLSVVLHGLPGLLLELRLEKRHTVIEFLKCVVNGGKKAYIRIIVREMIRVAGLKKEIGVADTVGREKKPDRRITEELLIKQVESLCKMDRYSAATRKLEQLAKFSQTVEQNNGPVHLLADQLRNLVAELHPDEEPLGDIEVPADIIPVHISAKQVMDGVDSLPSGSAAGYSGWTYNCIKSTVYGGCRAMRAEICETISELFNLFAANKGPRVLWLDSRLVFIVKTDGGWRPLGIGESWYRLLGRIVVHAEGPSIGDKLAPLQVGVGRKCGAEIAARVCQLALNLSDDMCCINLDLKNAFNSMPREMIVKGINIYAPHLLPLFLWSYGGPTPLATHDMGVVGKSKSGVRQGDPLGALFFCLGLQAFLEELDDAVQELVTRNEESGVVPGGVIGYMDDVSVFVPVHFVNEIIDKVIILCDKHHLVLNKSKCIITGKESLSIENPTFSVQAEMSTILGVPVGHDRLAVGLECSRLVSEATEPLKVIHKIKAQYGFNLMRACINPRAAYLARAMERDLSLMGLENFDYNVDDALLKVLGIADILPTGDIRTEEDVKLDACYYHTIFLRGLPTKLGGLGIARYGSVAGEKQCIHSRKETRKFIQTHFGWLENTTAQSWKRLYIGERGHYIEQAHLPPLDVPDEDFDLSVGESGEDDREDLKGVIERYHIDNHKRFLKYLIDNGHLAEAAELRSASFDRSGRWLSGKGNIFYGKHGLQSGDMLESLRTRCLTPPVTDSKIVKWTCPCATSTDLDSKSSFHFRTCQLNRKWIVYRHNAIRDALRDTILDVSKSEKHNPNLKMEFDLAYTIPARANQMKKADLVYTQVKGTHLRAIDISVVDASAKTYLEKHHSHEKAGIVAEVMEESKRKEYRGIGNR